MRIGIPKEIKPQEGRVTLIPAACEELIRSGHQVFFQKSAGLRSGYTDDQYAQAGAELCSSASELYAAAELIVKVKEPLEHDLEYLHENHCLFCFLHLAANHALMRRLREISLTAIAFETVQSNGALPLLAPMSEIAGKLAIQVGAHLLHQPQGGRGILLGGMTTTERGNVMVLGAGIAGGAAASLAAALGANVTVFDIQYQKLRAMRRLGANVTALHAYRHSIAARLPTTDLLIGAVLLPGKRAPRLVTREMVASMPDNSVLVDISVDQGGCIETTRATTYDAPIYKDEGVLHFCVTNIPGAVPRTASQALSASLLPYVSRLACNDWHEDSELAPAINVAHGHIVNKALQEEFESEV